MKTKILALLLALCVIFTALTSCDYIFGGGVADSGDVTVVVENADGSYDVYYTCLEEVENKSEGALGVLEKLAAREKDKLHLVVEDGDYGARVLEIGSLKDDAASGAYIMIYTSILTDGYEGAPTITYEETSLCQSGFGVSQMTVKEGVVILFRLEVYSW